VKIWYNWNYQKKEGEKIIQSIVLVVFTLIVIVDFFPNLIGVLQIDPNVLKYLILFFVLVSLFIPRYRKNKSKIESANFFPYIYIGGLVGILLLLGGKSSSGVLDGVSITLFIVLLISEVIRRKKSLKNI
jgi:asparagine N-glycosylation enzyme membrane subunit Stt3